MHSQLFAVLASRSQKTGHIQHNSGSCTLKPVSCVAKGNRLYVASNPPWTPGLHLLRLVFKHTFGHWHASRGKSQRLALDQGSAEFDPVQSSLDNQAAVSASVLPSAAASSEAAAIIDLDFSSFIIGDGVVTAFFILMVR